ncbi:D-3-phosphoglycerate dehydrogenase [Enterococcus florum]|uniref:D-3-phosphoglycerate dehydrogenase n=1 Tax=Enterococcus florum TaxID=2480627 RepID=A0A4P5PHN0_9ENTE|nr:NAD(P)-dependent oxidoreductase [Enterococcus florum]GCF95152.1 D-3-phosphoglycerate dehydrogenase [Enterococcus florum]
MYRVQLLAEYTQDQLTPLNEEKFEFVDQQTEAIMVRSQEVENKWLTKDLLAIARAGVGVNTIDIEACSENGTIVMNTPGQNANAVKELVLASLFLTARPIFEAAKMVEKLKGDDILTQAEEKRAEYIGNELQGKTIGLLGIGDIGTLVAEACHELGMNVLGYARNDPEHEMIIFSSLEKILKESNYIVVLLPLTKDTEKMIGAKELLQMKQDVFLLNFARREIVDSQAIVKAIEQNRLSGYITDFPEALLQGQSKILQLPHIGGTTEEALSESGKRAAESLRQFLLQGTVRDSINFPNVRLPFRADYRMTVFFEKSKRIRQEIWHQLDKREIEAAEYISEGKGAFVYLIVDFDHSDFEELSGIEEELNALSEVKRVRILKRAHKDLSSR